MGKRNKSTRISITYFENKLSLNRFLRRFLDTPEDVEDTLHETFLKAYQAERSNSIKSHRSYLFRTAKNLALNKIESRQIRQTHTVGDIESLPVKTENVNDLEQRAIIEERLEWALQAIANLPTRVREVYVLSKVHGLKQKDIAKQLGITESTVEKHIARGLMLITEDLYEKNREHLTQMESTGKGKTHDTGS